MESLPGEPMPPQVILGIGTGGIMSQNQPADPYWTRTALYSYLNTVDMPPSDLQITSKPGSRPQNMKSQLAACHDTAAASDVVRAGLIDMLARSMNSLPEDIDAAKPPTAYGVDSLVAVGLRTWVIGNCGVEVSVFEILSDNTVAELAELIAAKRNKGG
jgi:acyl carrier protein